jgi:hypothetical protein
MHTYRPAENGTGYTVGFECPSGILALSFRKLKTFQLEAEAAAFVNYLNGGTGGLPTTQELLLDASLELTGRSN